MAGLCTRIEVYKHAGYFEPHEADDLKARAAGRDVVHPPAILRQFVQRYGTGSSDGLSGGRGGGRVAMSSPQRAGS